MAKKIVPGSVVKMVKAHDLFPSGRELTVCHHTEADGHVVVPHPNGFGKTVALPLDHVKLVRNPD